MGKILSLAHRPRIVMWILTMVGVVGGSLRCLQGDSNMIAVILNAFEAANPGARLECTARTCTSRRTHSVVFSLQSCKLSPISFLALLYSFCHKFYVKVAVRETRAGWNAVLDIYRFACSLYSTSCCDSILGSDGNIVDATIEVDESFVFQTKESNCGRGQPSTHPMKRCFVLCCRLSGRVVLRMVSTRGHTQLLPSTRTHVALGALILSDCWNSYLALTRLCYDDGFSLTYRHDVVNHSGICHFRWCAYSPY